MQSFVDMPKAGKISSHKCAHSQLRSNKETLLSYLSFHILTRALQMALVVKNPPANAGNIRECPCDPWVDKIPWRRAWQPSPIFVPWTELPGKLQSIGSHRIRHH